MTKRALHNAQNYTRVEYISSVWDPAQDGLTQSIKVQNRAAYCILYIKGKEIVPKTTSDLILLPSYLSQS